MPRYSPDRARYEAVVASAHRKLFEAHRLAEQLGDEGSALDLEMLLRELTRLAEDSLRGRGREIRSDQLPAQTSIYDRA